MTMTAVMETAAIIAARTTIWNRPASSGEIPPKMARTNAPGGVTRPMVFVWSIAGISVEYTVRRAMSRVACRGGPTVAARPSRSVN